MNNALNSSNGVIRKHDVSSAFLAIYSSNLEGINITLNYIQNNYQKIIDYFDGTSTLLGILSDMVNRMTTESQIRKLESWISANSNSLSSISSEVQSYIANARSNLALEQQIATELYNFFNSS
ncbi:uncharacterized protein LOC112905028 [Agrilus planipennis]|nr:uncharacterized protein LOC112905028 [Agrilus planipennis]